MKLASHIHEGLLNLFSAKLRSLLALLGILVGTASVVAMVSGGKLATNEALKQFKTLGTELFAVSIYDADSNHDRNQTDNILTLAQIRNIYTTHKDIVIVSPYTQIIGPAQFENKEISGTALGVT